MLPAHVTDVAMAVAVAAVSVALAIHGPGTSRHVGVNGLDLLGLALIAASSIPLLWWRRAPFGVFTATAGTAVVLVALQYPIGFPVGATVSLYLLAASRDRSSVWSTAMTVTVVGSLAAYLAATAAADNSFPALALSHTSLAWAASWFAGERTRLRRLQLADLNERALRAELDAGRDRRLAVAEERARIARDLHDTAGHAVTVIAVRAGAARLRHAAEPGRSPKALEAIEELARHTAEEIDHIVGVLRENDADRSSPPGLASFERLLATHAAAELNVGVRTVGTVRPLGAAVDHAAYRILQEALTNATRHGADNASVDLRYTDASIDITVTNPVPAIDHAQSGGGHGLVGMRERATLLGGTIETGLISGDYVVHTVIPDRTEAP